MSRQLRLLCYCLLTLFSLEAHAQGTPSFETQIDASTVMQGNRFEVGFVLKNARGNIVPPDFKGFKVLGRNQLSGYGFVNGQSYTHNTWYYELEATQPGTFTIGPASVAVQGKTLRTQPLTITVKPNNAGQDYSGNLNAPPPGADADIFIAGEFDRNSAYVGEQVIFRINLYTRRTVVNYDILKTPDFHGFYSKDLERFDTRVQYRNLRGQKYAVRTLLAFSLYAHESGKLSVDPAEFKLGIDNGSGILGSILGASYILAQTQPAVIDIKPLPQPVPDNFSGGVGQYVWKVEPERDSMSTDDALTLHVVLEGTGDEKRFQAPRLALPAGLESFEPKIVESETYERGGEKWVHAQTLEYVVLPKAAGTYTFNPELVVFDPDSNRYISLKPDHVVNLVVTQGKTQQTPVTQNTETPDGNTGFSWRNLLLSPVFWGSILGASVLVFLLLFVLLRHREKPQAPPAAPAAPPPPSGRNIARDGIARARQHMQQGQVRAFYDALYHTLQAYFSAKLQLDPADMDLRSLQHRMNERQVAETHSGALLGAWQQCEQALFAGIQREEHMDRLLYQVETAIDSLEKMR